MENNTEKLLHYLYECSEEGVIPKIHSEDLMNLDFLKPFIKWLVDKDKIDWSKLKRVFYKANENNTATYPVMSAFSDYECLLMLLSIQDEPISFLVSILK